MIKSFTKKGHFIRSYFLIIFYFLILSSPVYSTTVEFGGKISSDTSWSADTILVTKKVVVDSAATLTIDSGTYVEFQDYFPLTVRGRLVAIGGKNDSIIFTSLSGISWAGIRFDTTNPALDTSFLRYCRVESAGGDDTLVDGNWTYGGGINAHYSKKIKISDCGIKYCRAEYSGGGICSRYSCMTIERCIIHNNN